LLLPDEEGFNKIRGFKLSKQLFREQKINVVNFKKYKKMKHTKTATH
jgi:hypothetical protein